MLLIDAPIVVGLVVAIGVIIAGVIDLAVWMMNRGSRQGS